LGGGPKLYGICEIGLVLREVTFLEVPYITSLNILAEVQEFYKSCILGAYGSKLGLLVWEIKEMLMYSKT
jgi:hypothetical protein